MCGIAGFLWTGLKSDACRSTANRMAWSLRHRGPDNDGFWSDDEASVYFAFRRLSVIDLTADGNQPMISRDGRWIIVMNGEIYNFQKLRRELELSGSLFRGHSDTEVILEAIAVWGPDRAIREATGMFAMAIWDRVSREVCLVRDRFGEKPLYYLERPGTGLAFSSELQALETFAKDSEARLTLDHDALALFFRYGFIPAPLSIYREVRKVAPGTILRYRLGQLSASSQYWSLDERVDSQGGSSRFSSLEDSVNSVHSLLRTIVADRMVSDVPLGAFLSGGVDSSLVVSLMQEAAVSRVKTFTIGFRESALDEAQFAKRVAARLGTEHSESYFGSSDALRIIPNLSRIYDEPFADSSQLATVLVSQIARRSVTVVLTGDGADESFGGYRRYFLSDQLRRVRASVPLVIRRCIASAVAVAGTENIARILSSVMPAHASTMSAERLQKLLSVLSEPILTKIYSRLLSAGETRRLATLSSDVPLDPIEMQSIDGTDKDIVRWMMWLDTHIYLPDDILVKVDRATMSQSLEARAPFLDHHLAMLAQQIPRNHLVHGGRGKLVLKSILKRYLPTELIERPKMGFQVPIAEWLRGPLREWAGDLFEEGRRTIPEIIDFHSVGTLWEQHKSGRRDHQQTLWSVLMFLSWRNARPTQ